MTDLDTPLPCDVVCGHIRFKKGVPLRVLAEAAARWLKAAQVPPADEAIATYRKIMAGVK